MASDDLKTNPGMKGYYRRPSKAIEKGGGFFIPGLEGSKIRFLSSIALIGFVLANRQGVLPQLVTINQITSELIAILSAIFLFLIGFIETISINNNINDLSTNYLIDLQNNQNINNNNNYINPINIAKEIINTSDGIIYITLLKQISDNDISIEVEYGLINTISLSNQLVNNVYNNIMKYLINKYNNNINEIIDITNTFNINENILLYKYKNYIWIIKSKSINNLVNNKEWIISLCQLFHYNN